MQFLKGNRLRLRLVFGHSRLMIPPQKFRASVIFVAVFVWKLLERLVAISKGDSVSQQSVNFQGRYARSYRKRCTGKVKKV